MIYRYTNAWYVNRLIKTAMKDEELGRMSRETYANKLRKYADMLVEPGVENTQMELEGMRTTTLNALKDRGGRK